MPTTSNTPRSTSRTNPGSTEQLERIETPAGDVRWLLNGSFHRLDGPAWEVFDGSEIWYRHGILHRSDGPAHTHADGQQEWYVDGVRHRTDGPAVLAPDGPRSWWVRNDIVSDSDDKALLGRLWEAGDIEAITHALSSWSCGGPTVVELVGAINAARGTPGLPAPVPAGAP